MLYTVRYTPYDDCAYRLFTERRIVIHNHNTERPRRHSALCVVSLARYHYQTMSYLCLLNMTATSTWRTSYEWSKRIRERLSETDETNDERRGSGKVMANHDSHKPKTRQRQPTRAAGTRGRVIEASGGDAPTHELTPLKHRSESTSGQSNKRRVSLPNKARDVDRKPTNCWIASRSAGGNALICSGVSCNTWYNICYFESDESTAEYYGVPQSGACDQPGG